jgi:formate dehydrogenase iron-sulfur subunit
MSRRKFIKELGIGAGALVAYDILSKKEVSAQTGTTYGALVDLRSCVNCKSCQIACKTWNGNTPDPTTFKTDFTSQTWTYVQEYETGTYDALAPAVKNATAKRQCMHCADPACVTNCPQNGTAIHKESNGAVIINHDNCIKCQICVNTCPYSVPRFDSSANKIEKCVFCFDKLEEGKEPACVNTCPPSALTFDTTANITTLANQAISDGYQVYGLDSGEETSWVYVFPKGIDPSDIIVTR